VCARVGNQRSHGVVTARVQTDAVQSLRHQHRVLHQSTYPVPLRRSGLILLSVVTTPLMVTTSLASEPEPSPLPGTLTGTLLWSGTSVMGLTKLSARWKGSDDSSIGWMTLCMCKQRCKNQSSHRPA
jgi:hypothetical protein